MQADYAAKKITFTVSWSATPENNKIWLLADYRKIENNAETGSWSRAPIAAASKTAGVGSASTVSGNPQGFWLNTSGSSGSATVAATLTLPGDVAQFNWCAYAFNAPPKATFNPASGYALHGTKPFKVNGADLAADAAVYSGDPPITEFTDFTGCPGIWDPPSSCPFTQPPVVGTFAAFPSSYSASTYVTLTDERDSKNYAVVKIGNNWIMAQNLNYQTGLTWQANANSPAIGTGSNTALIGNFWCPGGYSTAATISTLASCNVWGALYSWETAMMRDGKYAGAAGTSTTWPGDGTLCSGVICTNNMNQGGRGICPPNWHVPTDAEWGTLFDAMDSDIDASNVSSSRNWTAGDAGNRAKTSCHAPSEVNYGDEYVNDYSTNWYSPSNAQHGVDAMHFRAIPAGLRDGVTGTYRIRGRYSILQSASLHNIDNLWAPHMIDNQPGVCRCDTRRNNGQSVRCIRD
jgi:uncharacterized protein (TIGR02145 family)